MAEPIFKAKVVSSNKRTIMAAIATGCGILPIVTCLSVPSLSKYTLHVFVVIILFVVCWILFNKGKESLYELKKELKVYPIHIEIETIMVPFQEIEDLVFHFESYIDMRLGSYEPSSTAELRDRNAKDVYGLGNAISFMYKKQKFKYDFYVQNQAHFFQFVQMLEFLYQSQIQFKEENWYGKTFLMQNVNMADYTRLLAEYSSL